MCLLPPLLDLYEIEEIEKKRTCRSFHDVVGFLAIGKPDKKESIFRNDPTESFDVVREVVNTEEKMAFFGMR